MPCDKVFTGNFYSVIGVVAAELPLFKRGHDNCLRNEHGSYGQSDRYALPGPNMVPVSPSFLSGQWQFLTQADRSHAASFRGLYITYVSFDS